MDADALRYLQGLLSQRREVSRKDPRAQQRVASARPMYASDDDDQYLIEEWSGSTATGFVRAGVVNWDAQFGAWVAVQRDGNRAHKTTAARWISAVHDYRWCRDQADGDRAIAVTLHHALYN